MKHGRVFVALSFALASAVAAPQAAAAETCQYRAQDLPLPEGVRWAVAKASSDDNRLILGTTRPDAVDRGIVWRDGELEPLVPPPAGTGNVSVKDINNNGVVVGAMDVIDEDGELNSRAFRYQNGQYELLPVEKGERSSASGVNDAGDIVGQVWRLGTTTSATMWPVDGPRTTTHHEAEPIGITSDRKVVVRRTHSSPAIGWVVDLATGVTTPLPGEYPAVVVDNDRIIQADAGTIVELDLSGHRVATHEDGTGAWGKNSTGTMFGRKYDTSGLSETILWQQGNRELVETEQLPDPFYYGDVTDDGVLIGTHADWQPRPARWFRTCV
ncbi:DUF3466 family protein [Lentzea alba]|uniref:hypothetical protein n=1 Tax=Lentzea alba TaxID=2714351 RepID=UPI0039BEF4CE